MAGWRMQRVKKFKGEDAWKVKMMPGMVKLISYVVSTGECGKHCGSNKADLKSLKLEMENRNHDLGVSNHEICHHVIKTSKDTSESSVQLKEIVQHF